MATCNHYKQPNSGWSPSPSSPSLSGKQEMKSLRLIMTLTLNCTQLFVATCLLHYQYEQHYVFLGDLYTHKKRNFPSPLRKATMPTTAAHVHYITIGEPQLAKCSHNKNYHSKITLGWDHTIHEWSNMTTRVKVRIQITSYITDSSALTFHYSPYGETHKTREGETETDTCCLRYYISVNICLKNKQTKKTTVSRSRFNSVKRKSRD